MRPSKVIAKFTGADGSLGYRTGQYYVLEVMGNTDWIRFINGGTITGTSDIAIRRVRSWLDRLIGRDVGFCPYDTRQAFLDNWEVLGWL